MIKLITEKVRKYNLRFMADRHAINLNKQFYWFFIVLSITFMLQESLKRCLRVIPQETVDNNLGPDRLAGPKALDPN